MESVEYLDEQIGPNGIANTKNNTQTEVPPEVRQWNARLKGMNAIDSSHRGAMTVGNDLVSTTYGKNADNDYLSNIDWDNVVNSENPQEAIDERIVELQSNASRFGNALLNNAVIAGTTAIDGVVGTAYGLLGALATQSADFIWNNHITKGMNDLRTAATEHNFVSRGKEYENAGLWDRMKTGVFWADMVQNLGYTEGMLLGSAIPFGATGAAMNALGKVSKGAAAMSRYSRIHGNAAKTLGYKTAEVISGKILPPVVASLGEAATEAISNYEDKVKLKKQKAFDRYSQLSDVNPALREANQALLAKAYDDIENDERQQGNAVMGMNMVILGMSNMTGSFSSLLQRGYDTGRRAALNIAWDKAKKLGKGEIGFSDVIKLQNKPLHYAKATGKGILKAIPEGLEEGAQDFATYYTEHIDGWNRFYHSDLNPDKEAREKLISNANKLDEFKLAMMQAYADAMNDKNFSTDVMSGIITGLTGAPTIARNKRGKYRPTWGGGIWEQYSEANEKMRKGEEFIEQMKSRFDENKWKPFYTNVMRQMEINDRKTDALLRGDKKAYEDADVDGLLSDFIAFDEAGQSKLYKELVSSALDLTDEEYEIIANGDTSIEAENGMVWAKDKNELNEDGTVKETKKVKVFKDGAEAKEKIQAKAKGMLEKFDKYSQMRDKIKIQSPMLDSDGERKALYYAWNAEDRFERIKDIDSKMLSELKAVWKKYGKGDKESIALAEKIEAMSEDEFMQAVNSNQRIVTDENGERKVIRDDSMSRAIFSVLMRNAGLLKEIPANATQEEIEEIELENKVRTSMLANAYFKTGSSQETIDAIGKIFGTETNSRIIETAAGSSRDMLFAALDKQKLISEANYYSKAYNDVLLNPEEANQEEEEANNTSELIAKERQEQTEKREQHKIMESIIQQFSQCQNFGEIVSTFDALTNDKEKFNQKGGYTANDLITAIEKVAAANYRNRLGDDASVFKWFSENILNRSKINDAIETLVNSGEEYVEKWRDSVKNSGGIVSTRLYTNLIELMSKEKNTNNVLRFNDKNFKNESQTAIDGISNDEELKAMKAVMTTLYNKAKKYEKIKEEKTKPQAPVESGSGINLDEDAEAANDALTASIMGQKQKSQKQQQARRQNTKQEAQQQAQQNEQPKTQRNRANKKRSSGLTSNEDELRKKVDNNTKKLFDIVEESSIAPVQNENSHNAGEVVNASEIKEVFDQYNTDSTPYSSQLMDEVQSVAKMFGVKIVFTNERFEYRNGAVGAYEGNTVYLYADWFNTPMENEGKKAEVILHEMIHAVTAYAVTNKKNLTPSMQYAVNRLEDIFDEIKDNEIVRDDYGVTSVEEMIAELANPVFRERLKAIQSKKRSIWQRIIDAIKEFFGFTNDSVFDEVNNLVENIIDNYNVEEFEKYATGKKHELFKKLSLNAQRVKFFNELVEDIVNVYDGQEVSLEHINELIFDAVDKTNISKKRIQKAKEYFVKMMPNVFGNVINALDGITYKGEKLNTEIWENGIRQQYIDELNGKTTVQPEEETQNSEPEEPEVVALEDYNEDEEEPSSPEEAASNNNGTNDINFNQEQFGPKKNYGAVKDGSSTWVSGAIEKPLYKKDDNGKERKDVRNDDTYEEFDERIPAYHTTYESLRGKKSKFAETTTSNGHTERDDYDIISPISSFDYVDMGGVQAEDELFFMIDDKTTYNSDGEVIHPIFLVKKLPNDKLQKVSLYRLQNEQAIASNGKNIQQSLEKTLQEVYKNAKENGKLKGGRYFVSNLSVTVTKFNKGQLRVISNVHDNRGYNTKNSTHTHDLNFLVHDLVRQLKNNEAGEIKPFNVVAKRDSRDRMCIVITDENMIPISHPMAMNYKTWKEASESTKNAAFEKAKKGIADALQRDYSSYGNKAEIYRKKEIAEALWHCGAYLKNFGFEILDKQGVLILGRLKGVQKGTTNDDNKTTPSITTDTNKRSSIKIADNNGEYLSPDQIIENFNTALNKVNPYATSITQEAVLCSVDKHGNITHESNNDIVSSDGQNSITLSDLEINVASLMPHSASFEYTGFIDVRDKNEGETKFVKTSKFEAYKEKPLKLNERTEEEEQNNTGKEQKQTNNPTKIGGATIVRYASENRDNYQEYQIKAGVVYNQEGKRTYFDKGKNLRFLAMADFLDKATSQNLFDYESIDKHPDSYNKKTPKGSVIDTYYSDNNNFVIHKNANEQTLDVLYRYVDGDTAYYFEFTVDPQNPNGISFTAPYQNKTRAQSRSPFDKGYITEDWFTKFDSITQSSGYTKQEAGSQTNHEQQQPAAQQPQQQSVVNDYRARLERAKEENQTPYQLAPNEVYAVRYNNGVIRIKPEVRRPEKAHYILNKQTGKFKLNPNLDLNYFANNSNEVLDDVTTSQGWAVTEVSAFETLSEGHAQQSESLIWKVVNKCSVDILSDKALERLAEEQTNQEQQQPAAQQPQQQTTAQQPQQQTKAPSASILQNNDDTSIGEGFDFSISTEEYTQSNSASQELATAATLAQAKELEKIGIGIEVVSDEKAYTTITANRTKPQNNETTEYFRTPNGIVYGWASGNKIYLTRDGLNPNTPAHEYAHLWAKAIQHKDKKFWAEIKNSLKSTSEWEEVMTDENYENISDNEDAVASETLARLVGKRNAQIVNDTTDAMLHKNSNVTSEEISTEVKRKMSLVKRIWDWVTKNIFGFKSGFTVDELTNNIVADFWLTTPLGEFIGINTEEKVSFDVSDKEMQEIKSNAIADGTFMKAPNGKPTNLTERQWLQVRTKVFKDWFGDWIDRFINNPYKQIDEMSVAPDYESADAIGPGAMLPISINGEIIGVITLDAQIGKNGIYYFKKDYVDLASVGSAVNIDEEYRNQGYGKAAYIEAAKWAIKQGRTLRSAPDSSRTEDATRVWKSLERDGYAKKENNRYVIVNNAILKPDVSKVIDENGEPLVVYHVSSNKFHTFDKEKIGSGLGLREDEYRGFYFSTNKDVLKTKHQNKIYVVFLNARRVADDKGFNIDEKFKQHSIDIQTVDEFDKTADSYINRNTLSIGDDIYDEIVVKEPNQIKSATDNNGMFSTENDDINFSIGKTQSLSERFVSKAMPGMSERDAHELSKGLKTASKYGLYEFKEMGKAIEKLNAIELGRKALWDNFHTAFEMLFTAKEKEVILNEAKEAFGTDNVVLLQRKLADAFQEYWLSETDDLDLGKNIRSMLKSLMAKANNWQQFAKDESNINNLYQELNPDYKSYTPKIKTLDDMRKEQLGLKPWQEILNFDDQTEEYQDWLEMKGFNKEEYEKLNDATKTVLQWHYHKCV